MDKLLIAISSCWRFERNGWNNALRDTWLKDAERLGVDYKFFVGRTDERECPGSDMVVLDCPDYYEGLIYKYQEKCKWVVARDYSHVFHCYHDTYACVERLVSSGYETTDYMGDYYHSDPRQPWPHASYDRHCQSGQGCFMSRRVLKSVVEIFPKLTFDPCDEDWWTGEVVRSQDYGIKATPFMTSNLTPNDPGPRRNYNKVISCHLSTIQPPGSVWDKQGREPEWKYRPEYMYKLHREWEAS